MRSKSNEKIFIVPIYDLTQRGLKNTKLSPPFFSFFFPLHYPEKNTKLKLETRKAGQNFYFNTNSELNLNFFKVVGKARVEKSKNISCPSNLAQVNISFILAHLARGKISGRAADVIGGGALTLERGTGMCRGHDPLFSGQSPLPSLPSYPQWAARVTPFSIFRKFVHFQPCFGQNSSSLDQNFSTFSFPRPPFFKENPLPRPYILKPAWHTSTKKMLSALPGDMIFNACVYKDFVNFCHCHIVSPLGWRHVINIHNIKSRVKDITSQQIVKIWKILGLVYFLSFHVWEKDYKNDSFKFN